MSHNCSRRFSNQRKIPDGTPITEMQPSKQKHPDKNQMSARFPPLEREKGTDTYSLRPVTISSYRNHSRPGTWQPSGKQTDKRHAYRICRGYQDFMGNADKMPTFMYQKNKYDRARRYSSRRMFSGMCAKVAKPGQRRQIQGLVS